MQAFLEWLYAPRQIRALYELWPTIKQLFSLDGLKRAGALLLTIAEIFGVLLLDTPRTPRGPALDLTGYTTVVLEDKFDGDGLDLTKWEYRGTGKRTNSVGFFAPEQVRVEGGKLILTAEYVQDGRFGEGWYSGMIRTVQEYTYGYFEMTCIISKGGGCSSAWWLNSNAMASSALSKGGVGGAELDIFEGYNSGKFLSKNSVGINVHVDGYGPDLKSCQLGNWVGKDIYKKYNTYGLLWTDTEYIFYINGVEAARSAFKDGVSREPEYAIISLGMPSEEAMKARPGFKAEFIIDSVRILQKA